MAARRSFTADDRMKAAILLLEMLSSAPDGTVGTADAARALHLTERELAEVAALLATLADRSSGLRAVVSLENGTVSLTGDAAQMRPIRFTPHESEVLVHLLDALRLDDATRKRVTSALMPENSLHRGRITGGWRYGMFYRTLTVAIEDGVRCRILYRGASDKQPRWRLVDPHDILSESAGSYLIAWDVEQDGQRLYRLDRVGDVAYTDDSVTPHAWEELTVRESLQRAKRAVVICSAHEMARRPEWEAMATGIDRTDSGDVTLIVSYASEPWLFDQVLAAGGEARIVSPDALAAQLRTYAAELLGEVS